MTPVDRLTPTVRAAMSPAAFSLLFDEPRLARLHTLARVPDPLLIDPGASVSLVDTEVLFTSWGAPRLDATMLDRMPRLRAVLHAAGSVHGVVSDDLWERGILVTSAADANAVPVAEFTFAAVIMAFKRAFTHVQQHTPEKGEWGRLFSEPHYGSLGRTVGVVGFSRIGRRVVSMLQQLDDIEVLVADPMVSPERVAAAGATLVPLDEMLPRVDVLSLHAPALASTYRMIGAAELGALRAGATLINTARGALVDPRRPPHGVPFGAPRCDPRRHRSRAAACRLGVPPAAERRGHPARRRVDGVGGAAPGRFRAGRPRTPRCGSAPPAGDRPQRHGAVRVDAPDPVFAAVQEVDQRASRVMRSRWPAEE